MITRHGTLLLLTLIGLLLADVAQAKPDYLNAYEAGLHAIERQDWSRASALMQKALMERAEEASRLTQWFFWQPYVPHYYYGVARFHLGDCPQALRSFQLSEEQGVLIDEDELYPTMLDLRERCKGQRAAAAGPGDSQEQRVRVSDLAESGDRILGAADPLVTSPEGKKRMQQTRTGLNVAKVTDEEAERISELADGSAPPALDRAVTAFFSGNPRQALATLDGFEIDRESGAAETDRKKILAHVQLIRAAAAYRLYLLSAETDQNLLDRAVQYARAFKAAGHPVSPPASLFGPRFLDFLAASP
ncbi:MAG: hypothetical protein AAGD38_08070 [Acidobacteriota bacterium]